ncbi:unnamed protein product [Cylindrotheca closterium]|uniref:Transglutaminase-like domain-containing protein n=1 Tax=Cylindrotheca closterium TaxID=2856 RepID=A0AAD2FGY5_9STRA|nr:unnamed protein product [Cylindrotheca closterium]
MRSFANLAMHLGFSLFAVDATQLDDDCRSSNATHIVWKISQTMATMPTFGRRRSQTTLTQPKCVVQPRKQAEQECLKYLQDTIMPFDVPFFETLGFGSHDDDVDGLGNGIATVSVKLALDAKAIYPWTDSLPKEIFYNYVLNYANLNEARTNWRPLLIDAMNFTESPLWKSGNANLSSVVTWVNTHLWTQLSRDGSSPIYFKSGQTPLIFDPMSVIAYGYASCTGTSILFSNALRALGIPSRVAGTPAWYGNATQGNHNWVEVYDNGIWKFLEPSPALAHVDTLEADPCHRWFCNAERYPSSKVYAATLSKVVSSYFPLAWEWHCKDIPAVDRTQYYADICSSCD